MLLTVWSMELWSERSGQIYFGSGADGQTGSCFLVLCGHKVIILTNADWFTTELLRPGLNDIWIKQNEIKCFRRMSLKISEGQTKGQSGKMQSLPFRAQCVQVILYGKNNFVIGTNVYFPAQVPQLSTCDVGQKQFTPLQISIEINGSIHLR